jgi:hypothetical protein
MRVERLEEVVNSHLVAVARTAAVVVHTAVVVQVTGIHR